ncbi:MAG: signal peptidase II [Patescibacteria group bacterium]|nr:signal peptidase II [Patescibacteria group bacterium]
MIDKINKIVLINFVGIFLFALDRFSKNYIFKNPGAFQDFSIKNLLQITFSRNYNLALGIKINSILLFILILLSIFLLIYFLYKNYQKQNFTNILIITIVLCGALSNLLDRFLHGFVIDFINVPWFSVFNFADCYIVIGVFTIIVRSYFKKEII